MKIVKGKKAVLTVRLNSKKTKDPFDFSSCDNIETCFDNEDGTQLELELGSGIEIIGSPLIGKIQITLTALQTKELKTVTNGSIELAITLSTDASNPISAIIDRAYSVVPSHC